jgi:hypothetical protein
MHLEKKKDGRDNGTSPLGGYAQKQLKQVRSSEEGLAGGGALVVSAARLDSGQRQARSLRARAVGLGPYFWAWSLLQRRDW